MTQKEAATRPHDMNIPRLRRFNQLIVKHVERFGRRDDFKILLEIAAQQETGAPLTLKRLVLCCSVPESTLKRRLSRLVREGFVHKRMTEEDHRVHCYTVAERTLKQLRSFIVDIRAFDWR